MMSKVDQIALVLVDIQNDFLPPSGSLAVANGRSILPVVHQVLKLDWRLIAASQDFHPHDHISFASTHDQEPQFPPNTDPDTGIALWPVHCVQGTKGCEIEDGIMNALLESQRPVHFVKKGQDRHKEEYSAFESTGKLDSLLKSHNISHLVCLGLAADYCVAATVRSALAAGYHIYWLSSGTQAVGGPKVQFEVESEFVNAYPGRFQVVTLEEVQSFFEVE